MITRAKYIEILCQLVGTPAARLIDARDGWPGHVELQLSTGPKAYSIHVAPVSSMARKENKPYEFRFQGPGKIRPMKILPGTTPLLLGIWDQDEPNVIVAAQPETRMGSMKRLTALFPERLFREAQFAGWAEPYKNSEGSLHWSFFPQLLPTFAELYETSTMLPPNDIQIAVVGAGLVDTPGDESAARARRVATMLMRSAKFRHLVIEAYDKKCAMCGLNLGLVSGAHILPVSAPTSSDAATNGLALCDNHHRAFDTHRVWIHPDSRKLKLHPTILTHAEVDARSKNFVETTFPQVINPKDATLIPPKKMFIERYAYFKGNYDWAV